MRCRKNYRALTSAEKDRFVAALYHVKAIGVVDQFANEHSTLFHHGIHETSHFLPWHRDFVRRFEDALRAFDARISIPYWNSTVDQSPSDPLWAASFMGQFDAAWSLGRSLGGDTLPTPAQLTTVLGLGTYDVFWDQLENVIHNSPHNWVGGAMATTASPHDPMFFLHHCWIDLCWAEWQLLNPGAAFVSSGAGFGLDDPMPGRTTTPHDVLDHRTINVYDYPPTFTKRDAPRVTADLTTVNFLDVPAGETRAAAARFALDTCETLTLRVTAGPTLTSGPAGTMFGVLSSPVPADPEVDQTGRLFFTYKGTSGGDTATASATVGCDETGDSFPIQLAANTIARPKAAIAMLLDQSNSMNFDSGIGPGIARKDVLRFSAPTAVIVLDDQHSMAVSTFDQDAHPGIGLTPAAGAGKVTINAAIAAYAPNPNGWTAIGEGVAFAQGLLAPATGFDVKAMVVLTDGQEEHGPYARRYIADVTDLINSLNGRVFAIGLGRAEVLNPTALQSLCSGNNGYLLLTGDLNPDATYRLAKYYQQIFAGVTNNEIVLDPDGFVTFGVEQRIPFWLNETDIEAKCILLTPAPYAIRYVLETPDGDIIDPGVAAANPNASFGAGGQVAFYWVGLPIPLGAHEAQAGRWYARLAIDDRRLTQFSTFEQPASAFASAVHGMRFSFTVQAYSNLRMRALLAQTSNEPGATLTVRAVLTEYGLPVASRALCGAELTRPDGTSATLGMPEIEPGVFERTVTASLPGIYRFRVVGAGKTLRGRPFTREQTLTGAVWKGGDAKPPTLKDDPSARDDRFCRLIDCLLHEKTIQATLRKAGVNLDELLRCLEDYCRKPSPGQPPRAVRPKLEDRLRSIIRDNPVLQAVMHELQQEKE